MIGQIGRIKQLYSPTGEYNKTKILKMAASHFVEVTSKEISKIKINSVPKTQKTKTIIRLRLGEYSPRLRLGEYSPIITSANNCQMFTIF